MKLSTGIKTVRDKVEDLLFRHEPLRDNDMLLWFAYLNEEKGLRQMLGEAGYQILKQMVLDEDTPKFESISRARRAIQETGKYQGKFRLERMKEQEAVKEVLSGY